MTLIELLIVLGILMFLAGMAVAKLKPAMDRAKTREAARAIQLYLSSARNQAIASGRSCGVLIEPLPSEMGCAMTLKQVETPVSYGGDSVGSTATVTNNGDLTCTITLSSPTSVPLHVGDLIQVGYQGYWMQIFKNPVPVGGTTFQAGLDATHGETPFWFNLPKGVPGPTLPYKILRWPTQTDAAALQLPSPTVIDLNWCGADPIGGSQPTWPIQPPTPPAQPVPLIIMFAADGRIDWVSNSANPSGLQVTTPIYLLVGVRNKVFDNPADPNIDKANLNDFQSLWVSIDAATGLITVADMAALPQNPKSIQPVSDLWASRAFARQAIANAGGK